MPLNNRLVNQPFDAWEGSGARFTGKIKDSYPVKPELCTEPDWMAKGMSEPEPCLRERPCPVHDKES